jgi:hypothetical protein
VRAGTLFGGFLVLTLAVVGPGTASPRTWTIDQDGEGNFATLLEGLAAAAAGDTILIGPGRFLERAEWPEHSSYKWQAYAPVTLPDLTLIGAGQGLTILGPETPFHPDEKVVGIVGEEHVTGLTIESLTVANMPFGLSLYGDLRLSNVEFQGITGIAAIIYDGEFVSLSDLRLRECEEGVEARGAQHIEIRRCRFSGASRRSLYLVGRHVLVSETESSGAESALHVYNSEVTIQRSRLTGVGTAVGASRTASLVVVDSHLEGGDAALSVSWGDRVQVQRNALLGGTGVVFLTGTSNVEFNGNEILSTAGRTIYLNDIYDMYREKLNFRYNWWGTTDPDSIQAWIVDADHPIHENDPREEGYVEFLPLLQRSVPAQVRSVGSLKGRLHRR